MPGARRAGPELGGELKDMDKRPRTTNEKRSGARRGRLLIDEYVVHTRAKRNACRLANAWDDVPCASRSDRSWKSCTKRRKQRKD